MTGPYAIVGARLVERGYAAIPIMPGTKRPGHRKGGEWLGLPNWHERYRDRLPTGFELSAWSQSDGGVCVVCGPASAELIAVDIDTDDPAIVAAIHSVLPPTSVRKTGAKGETLFFRGPGIASKSFNIAKKRVCDLIGPGRQTVLPPTIHPDTHEPYRWTGPDALEDMAPAELPEIDADLAERIAAALAPLGYEPERELLASRDHPGDADSPHRALNEAALANLSWVPKLGLYRCRRTHHGYEAVATWRASSTGRPDEARKPNLKIVPDGIRDFGADRGYTPIDLVMASQGCDLDTAFRFLAESVGWASSIAIVPPLPPPAELKTAALEPLLPLTRLPGVVGDLVDWITATARRPNRVLALGAAVTIAGTLIGRRVAGPTRTGTHLYVVTLAPTGAGKQHAIACTHRLMAAAGAKHHIGPSQFMSMSAVINRLQRSPLCLCTQDEFGAFLRRVNSKKATGHETGISMVLRSVWGASFEAVTTPEWAGRGSETISSPALSIHGLSTPQEFYDALQAADLSNGFLNRILVISIADRVPDTTPQLPPGDVPPGIVAALQELYNWDGTTLGTARLNDPDLDPDPDVLPWASPAAHKVYLDAMRQLELDMDATPHLSYFLARAAEIAVRLATIRAAARWARGAAIDVSDMEWGRDVAFTCGRLLAAEAALFLAETERQSWSNRILRLFLRRGTVSIREIQQHLRGALKSAEVKDILAGLCEEGTIDPVFDGSPAKRIVAYKFIGRTVS